MSRAYYNEIDAHAAAWLRELIRAGLIADGDVDERSIVDVRSDDLRGYAQCHFFAGIGVWSYALRRAGWSDARPVWTGSCPCQPFSAAGKGDGYADERHLWPHWLRLIGECRPATIFGEQVDAAIRTGWLDDVCLSLESLGYAIGAVDFPACSVGAPHIRQRLYFVGSLDHAADARRQGAREHDGGSPLFAARPVEPSAACCMADAERSERRPHIEHDQLSRGWEQAPSGPRGGCDARDVADAAAFGLPAGPRIASAHDRADESQRLRDADVMGNAGERAGECAVGAPGATNGFWRDAIWIPCRDGKARAVKSGLEPLVDGAPARVVRLRGYGNGLVAEQARTFIEAYLAA